MAPPKPQPSSPTAVAATTDDILVDESSTVHFSKIAVDFLKKCVLEEKLTGLKVDVERRQEIAALLNCPESRVTNWIRNFSQTLKKSEIPSRPALTTSPKSTTDSTKPHRGSTSSSSTATASPSLIVREIRAKEIEARRRITSSTSATADVAVHVTKELLGRWNPGAEVSIPNDDDDVGTPSKSTLMPPTEGMSTRERVVWKKQLRGTLKRTLDALEELGCPSILATFDADTHAGTYEPRGAIAVHATEHVRNIHDLNLDTLLPDIAVIRRQFPALYPAPANPFKQQEKVWAHVLGALNDELRRMGQPSRKQIPWHALVSGTIGVKARNGTEKRKFDLVNWPAQVPKRKKLDEAQCALLLQNLPAVHVAISDTSLAGEGADDDDGNVGGEVSKEGADEEHDDDATEDGDSPKV
ncbi:hypothetical protein, variant [Aphanomyces astaci]|uniref:Homeobox domain-containing protein n=1 Tax=Aphanomyces astaci TaxID=112090 RepID=W4G1E1_APHAT|nr:hypothetical protein, variant [Aphanomyces astaci]ETV73515.1 hypothetical protein, variant [Aphanomyces astaci]|eukprot:XP_009836941.1 hypothetical protein, variant [Aphanomyces astaci]